MDEFLPPLPAPATSATPAAPAAALANLQAPPADSPAPPEAPETPRRHQISRDQRLQVQKETGISSITTSGHRGLGNCGSGSVREAY